jgi:hypothetical protein
MDEPKALFGYAPSRPVNIGFGVTEQMIAALVKDGLIPDGQGDRVLSVDIRATNDGVTLVTVTMVATEEFLKCLTP